MRVFVTGATGFIGSAIVKELIEAGHKVLGLVRSDESAKALAATGAEVHRGTLDDLDSLRSGVAATDGVIHTAFIHDFFNYAAACATDKLAIETMVAEIGTSDKPIIITSGALLLTPGRLATEEDFPTLDVSIVPRIASEILARSLAEKGIKISVVRLAPSVHDNGDHGFVPQLISIAREKGVSAYIGEGLNRWPAIHRLDAAHLYRLALEKGAVGAFYHGVADEGVPCREIAEVIGSQLNLPVVSISPEVATEHFSWMGRFFAIDGPTSSKLTQEWLKWRPTHPSLLADLEKGTYFKS
ncbi:nucleoside-diphosphate-sugar epimerase [Mucilaginibacter frigoritolerans]|uniref:Nucleoside-diphosphate-sugar epimerase n=1 Tax=Mucilaginibacter frigoritolerans TaxID=652788 RepID=A0A562TNF5_9SPHI|nr:SDR family oxidoreductase [Mucilaginibacter frigoritolerans]TWI94788.1 nucleoside-diphosphate-sugar epimerase [Mucilaginibacter frigoritolerans]